MSSDLDATPLFDKRDAVVAGFSKRLDGRMFAFETRCAGEAAQRMADIHGDSMRVEKCATAPDFHLRLKAVTRGATALVRADVANWRVMRETHNSVVVTFCLRGAYYCRVGRNAETLGPARQTSVVRPYEYYCESVPRGAGMSLVLPAEDLTARAERLADKALADSLIQRLPDEFDPRTPAARGLSRGIEITMSEAFALAPAGLEGLIMDGAGDLLSNLAVAALFPQIFMTEAQSADCGPRTIRRARDYLREHAAEPLELSRLAAELGVSMRSLQENFRRYYGASPREFVLSCRLDLARERLLAADVADSVTLIAAEAGFGDLGRFSSKYRARFGELPSETLRFARG